MPADETNTVGCMNNLLHSMFSSLSVSLNGKPATLHETNIHYKAYLEKLLTMVLMRQAHIYYRVSGFLIRLLAMEH